MYPLKVNVFKDILSILENYASVCTPKLVDSFERPHIFICRVFYPDEMSTNGVFHTDDWPTDDWVPSTQALLLSCVMRGKRKRYRR